VAARAGAPLVIVNRDPTPLDGLAALVINAGIGETLRAADRLLPAPASL
jgi:NAD-dependent deacetylase